jgi:hypothetical protein
VRNSALCVVFGALALLGCSSNGESTTEGATFCGVSRSLLDLLEEASDPARLSDTASTTRARAQSEHDLVRSLADLAPESLAADVGTLSVGLDRQHEVLERYGHDRLRLQTEAGFGELDDLLALRAPDALQAMDNLLSGIGESCQVPTSTTIDEG